MSLKSFGVLVGSELVRAQQSRDHVDSDNHSGGAVDQLHDHGQIRRSAAA
jgi:hypothetical protein